MTPLTITFGPWLPDISNVAVPISYPLPLTVPLADCNNLYYADGDYKSLPTPGALTSAVSGTVGGAATAIGPGNDPYLVVGTTSGVYEYNGAPTSSWTIVVNGSLGSPSAWSFAQYGQTLYAAMQVPAAGGSFGLTPLPMAIPVGTTSPNGLYAFGQQQLAGGWMKCSTSGTVLTVVADSHNYGSVAVGMGVVIGTFPFAVAPDQQQVFITSFGTGTGGVGTYNLSSSALGTLTNSMLWIGAGPTGKVIATVGQFLMLGDIVQSNSDATTGTDYLLGTGNGTTTTFTGTVPLVAVVPFSLTLTAGGRDNGAGVISGSGAFGTVTGTINYATGAISVTFATAPTSGVPILVDWVNEWMARLYWSAIAAPNLFPIPNTNAAVAVQSGFQDMDQSQGPIMFIAGYPLYAVVFQRTGITRVSYVGGQTVWNFQNFEQKRGLLISGSACQVDQLTFFLSDEGFFVTDGASVVPIGTASDNSAGVDNWFKTNVNKNALSAISASYDASLRCVTWAIPTGSNTSPDTLLIYNPRASRWTKSTTASALIWTDSDGSFHRLGLIDQTGKYNLLTGTPSIGYAECCDVEFADSNIRYVSALRPNIACTDTPSAVIGTRLSLSASVTYSASSTPDAFSQVIPFLPQDGIYVRFRLSSAGASAMTGGALLMETGGEV